MSARPSPRYNTVAILLHWVIAALLLFMIWLGWNMDDNEARFQLHKSLGIAILVLTVARIAWRRMNPPPPLPEDMTAWEKRLSHGVHSAFYALMLALPLLGWLVVSTSKFQVPTVLFGSLSWPHLPFTEGLRGGAVHGVAEFLHSKGAWALILLLGLHVAGAIKHEIAAEEGVFKRMIPMLGPTSRPRRPHGLLTAFGGAGLAFMLIAALPLLFAPRAPAPLETQPAANGTAKLTPNWEIDYDTSEIRFAGTYENKPFSGHFTRWAGEVQFDPEDLASARVRVQVDTGSAITGKKLYDDTLHSSEWFDTATFPLAKVNLSKFAEAETGYSAEASILIKGKATNVPLEFTLTLNGDEASFSGITHLSRKALNLGQQSDPGADWVSDEVTVTFTGSATRLQ